MWRFLSKLSSKLASLVQPPHTLQRIFNDSQQSFFRFFFSSTGQKTLTVAVSFIPSVVLGYAVCGLQFNSKNECTTEHKQQCSPELSKEEVLALRQKHLGKCLKTFYENPIMIVRGEGQYLYDENGRQYLDAYNNVQIVGHSHPEVVRVATEQMSKLNLNTRYLHPNIVRYAEKLTATLPKPLSVVFFVNSGSEANDLALQLAKAYTKNTEVIVNDDAYHGTTVACVEISPNKWYGQHSGTPIPSHTHVVSVPDTFRGPYKATDPDAGKKYAAEIRDVIAKLKAEGKSVAAFFCESIQGCGGQIPLPPNYLQEAYRYVHEAGGVCVADEVQVGFGRSGTHFWAFETQGVVPDIVTLGKPIANGYPMGAVVTTPEIAAAFDKKEYFNTFGGNAVACAIALSVLEVIQKEKLQENARVVGDYLTRELKKLQEKHPLIGDVRGLGLFMGIELVKDRNTLEPAPLETKLVVEKMKDYGILTALNGKYENVIRIKPPLCFSKANAQFFVSTLDRVLTEISQQHHQQHQQQRQQLLQEKENATKS